MLFTKGDLAFWLVLFFIFGIFSASLELNFLFVVLIITLALFLFIVFLKRKYLVKILPFLIFAFFAGSFYFNFRVAVLMSPIDIKYNSFISIDVVIDDEPIKSEKYLIFNAIGKIKNKNTILKIFTLPEDNLNYGDLINIEGTIVKSNLNTEPPLVFTKTVKLISKNNGFWLRQKLLDFKNLIIVKFKNFLQNDNASLLSGITLGSQTDFTPEFKNDMSLSGTTHLVAMSGYNITIIVLAVQKIFGNFLSRKKTFFISIIFILFFIIMTGLQTSVIRAGITGFIALLSYQAGKLFNIRNAIIFTAFAMLLWDPFMIVKNISFQLSFLSLLGIVYLSPVIKSFLGIENSGFLDWKESAVMTLSAQLAVLPILIISFGRFSIMAIFANIAILGIIPITMFLGFVLIFLGFISYYFAFFCAKFVTIFLSYECMIIKFFANIYVPVPIHFNSGIAVFFYYAFFCFLIAKFQNKYEKK